MVRYLVSLRLVEQDESLAGDSVHLTGYGQTVAKKIEQSFVSGGRRREAIRRGVLQAMRDRRRVASTDLAEHWTGRPLEPTPNHDEIAQAFTFLQEQRLIKAQGMWGGAFFGIGVEPAGHDALDQGRQLVTGESSAIVNDYRDQSNNLNQYGGSIGAAALGNDNRVSGTVNIVPDQAAEIREALQQALTYVDKLPESDRQPVSEALGDALDVASAEAPKRTLLRRCVEDGLRALSSAAGSDAGESIRPILAGILQVV